MAVRLRRFRRSVNTVSFKMWIGLRGEAGDGGNANSVIIAACFR
ncbi:MAG: hypothetical protein ACKESB_03225 [Candidatus Hodgkinia cicadicola]